MVAKNACSRLSTHRTDYLKMSEFAKKIFSKSSPPTVYTMTFYIRLPYFSPFFGAFRKKTLQKNYLEVFYTKMNELQGYRHPDSNINSPYCICLHQVGSMSSFLPTYELIKEVLTVDTGWSKSRRQNLKILNLP
jgi:hypothetical protein